MRIAKLICNLERVKLISDWKTGFRKVAAGEIDAIVVDRWIGEYELAQSGIRGIQIIDEPIETQYSRTDNAG